MTVTPAQSRSSQRFGAARVAQIPVGGLVDLLHLARELGAVDLAGGVPSWPLPPEKLVDQALHEIRDGDNQYEHPVGSLELRTAIAAAQHTPTDPVNELTITVGASEALAVAVLATVDPGDEVIVFEPGYENFLTAIALAGGRPRFVPLDPQDWRWDSARLAAAFGPRTRAVIINSPSNPTGRVLTAAELAELGELCERWGSMVISDEVYAAYVYDGRSHVSAADVPELRDRSIVLGSLSKSHAVSGWRLGHLRAAAPITTALRRVHVGTSCGAPGPLQRAVARSGVLDGSWQPAAGMQQRRDRTLEIFRRYGLRCPAPEGGCYVMADIRPRTAENCESFVRSTVRDRGVLVVPGRYFYENQHADSGYVRIAFNRSLHILDSAEQRLLGTEQD